MAAELRAEVRRPQTLAPDLVLQRVDDRTPRVVERYELQVREQVVEWLDLLPHESVSPVQLLLVLGLGLEIPRHLDPPCAAWQNTILVVKNAIPSPAPAEPPVDDIAGRIAQKTLAKRGADYTDEVRRLLDAALAVMRECGTASRPRVADIVAAAGLSNDAFYRHFSSKDALVGALLEDGAARLVSYLDHQMAKEATAERKVRRWVEGVLSQTNEEIAATTLAVMWNGGTVDEGTSTGRHFASAPLSALLHEPFSELGAADPELEATLVAHAVLGKLSDHLWQRTRPTRTEVHAITAFCLRCVERASR